MLWKQIIKDDEKTRYKEKLDEIAKVLLKESSDLERMGLMHGKAGVAIFLFYYAELSGKEAYYDKALSLISDSLEYMGQFSIHSFSRGEPGVGWALEHLVRNEFLEYDTDQILVMMDKYIASQLQAMLDSDVFDIVNGATGLGIYMLSRLPRPKPNVYITRLVDGLEKKAIRTKSGGIAWESTVWDLPNKPKGINLGLLYGMAGIMVFLSKLVENDIYKEKAQPLLEGATAFLLNESLPQGLPYRFPGWAGGNGNTDSCGLSLGYGDLSAGLALWHAATALGNPQWKKKAEETLLLSTKLTKMEENRIMDASLTVGTSGIAHVYNRMFQLSSNDAFREAACFWLEQTLTLGNDSQGFAGFKAWRSKKSKHKDKDFALFEGLAGIGLVLISAIAPVEPKWDRCLFLN